VSDKDQLQAKRKKKFEKQVNTLESVDSEQFIYWILKTLKMDVRFNTVLQRQEYNAGEGWKQWTDEQDMLWLEVRNQFEHKDFKNEKLISQAIAKHAYSNKVNPVREYLESCPRDWVTWAMDNMHVVDGAYLFPGEIIAQFIDSSMDKKTIAEIFNAWLAGCALHGHDPDNNQWAGATVCPILTGPQGCNKSRFTAWLGQAAGKEYYNESVIDADNKDNRIALATTWIWAADEFSGTMIKSKSETIKNFLTRKSITERLPYGKRVQTMPRMASLIGTDNNPMPLRDTTGNRRFAVIPIERVRLEEMQKALPLDRLWGGAMHLLTMNQTPAIAHFAQQTVNQANEMAVDHHPWVEVLMEKLKFSELSECTSLDIFQSVLGICSADQDDRKSQKLGKILASNLFKELGVRQVVKRRNGKITRVWVGCGV
jgi:predicted P-loop ATPase